jgi:hypothetical protein
LKVKLQVFVFIALIPGTYSIANTNFYPLSARSQGMGRASVMLADLWSAAQNPSGLATLDNFSFAFHYENHFLVPEFGLGAFALNMPTKSGIFGLHFSCYGYSLYRESQTCLSFGKSFGQKFRAGIGAHYLSINQSLDYGNLFAIIPCLGFQIIPFDKLTFGFQVLNPACQHFISVENVKIQRIIHIGFGYLFGDEFIICLEAEKKLNENPDYYGGFEYNFLKSTAIRFGIISGEYTRFSFGIGVQNHQMKADFAMTRHPVLGFSPSITIGYSFK